VSFIIIFGTLSFPMAYQKRCDAVYRHNLVEVV